jgi:hypothetical protein
MFDLLLGLPHESLDLFSFLLFHLQDRFQVTALGKLHVTHALFYPQRSVRQLLQQLLILRRFSLDKVCLTHRQGHVWLFEGELVVRAVANDIFLSLL